MKKDKFLDNKVEEVINDGSEIEYLGIVFRMFAFEKGIKNNAFFIKDILSTRT